MPKTIKEIDQLLNSTSTNEDMINELKQDPRKGVQILLNKWDRQQEGKRKAKEKYIKMSSYENNLYERQIDLIAGVDEVGRGPLAGPVVAAAVILGRDFYLPGLNDSKAVSEQKREIYFDYIMKNAIAVGVGSATATEIDEINILQASKLAMKRAVESLPIQPEYLLIDAMEISMQIPQESIIKGDAKSVSIAASSIIAKVTRDRYMVELGLKYPQYGFEKHMGYGTAQHIESIVKNGIIDEHRRTFAPIKQYV